MAHWTARPETHAILWDWVEYKLGRRPELKEFGAWWGFSPEGAEEASQAREGEEAGPIASNRDTWRCPHCRSAYPVDPDGLLRERVLQLVPYSAAGHVPEARAHSAEWGLPGQQLKELHSAVWHHELRAGVCWCCEVPVETGSLTICRNCWRLNVDWRVR